jgi:hypothetical protein
MATLESHKTTLVSAATSGGRAIAYSSSRRRSNAGSLVAIGRIFTGALAAIGCQRWPPKSGDNGDHDCLSLHIRPSADLVVGSWCPSIYLHFFVG